MYINPHNYIDTVVEFKKTLYHPPPTKNTLLKPVLELSNPTAYPIQVTIQVENGTAKRE